MRAEDAFPLNSKLWPGCILASIAHAVFVCRAPMLAQERFWRGSTCFLDNTQGDHGAITFGSDRCRFVALFFAHESDRSPFARDMSPENGNEGLNLLRTVPPELWPLIETALPLLTLDVNGVSMPVITSAFWSGLGDGYATSCEPWDDVSNHGASLIENELLDDQVALVAWTRDMALTDAEMAFVAALYRRRLAAGSANVVLSRADVDQLRQFASGKMHRFFSGDEGFQACTKRLGEIGIFFPTVDYHST